MPNTNKSSLMDLVGMGPQPVPVLKSRKIAKKQNDIPGDKLMEEVNKQIQFDSDEEQFLDRLTNESKNVVFETMRQDPIFKGQMIKKIKGVKGEKLRQLIIDEADVIKIDRRKQTDPTFNSAQAAAAGFIQGISLGYGHKLTAAADAFLKGESYDQALAEKIEEYRLLHKAFPKSDIAGEIASFFTPGSLSKGVFEFGAKFLSKPAMKAIGKRLAAKAVSGPQKLSLANKALTTALGAGGGTYAYTAARGFVGDPGQESFSPTRAVDEALKLGAFPFVLGAVIPPAGKAAEAVVSKPGELAVKGIKAVNRRLGDALSSTSGVSEKVLREYAKRGKELKQLAGKEVDWARDFADFFLERRNNKLPEVIAAEGLIPKLPKTDIKPVIDYLKSFKFTNDPGQDKWVKTLKEWANRIEANLPRKVEFKNKPSEKYGDVEWFRGLKGKYDPEQLGMSRSGGYDGTNKFNAQFFTSDIAEAKLYAEGTKANIIKGKLKLENPLIVDEKQMIKERGFGIEDVSEIIDDARINNHDGVIIKNLISDEGVNPRNWAVSFSPEQVTAETLKKTEKINYTISADEAVKIKDQFHHAADAYYDKLDAQDYMKALKNSGHIIKNMIENSARDSGTKHGDQYIKLMQKASHRLYVLDIIKQDLGSDVNRMDRRALSFFRNLFGVNAKLAEQRMRQIDETFGTDILGRFEQNFLTRAQDIKFANQIGPQGLSFLPQHATGKSKLGIAIGTTISSLLAPFFKKAHKLAEAGGLAVSSPRMAAWVLGSADKFEGFAERMINNPEVMKLAPSRANIPSVVKKVFYEIEKTLKNDGPQSAKSLISVIAKTPIFVGIVHAYDLAERDYMKGVGKGLQNKKRQKQEELRNRMMKNEQARGMLQGIQ